MKNNPFGWPVDYVAVFAWRQKRLEQFKQDTVLAVGALEYYRTHPVEFISHWVDTYDPRNAGKDMPVRLPFILFPKQVELIKFLHQCVLEEQNGLIEKSRDMGATWASVGFTVWLWLFVPGSAIGWGSRKEQLVDKIGDPDSIFEKIRLVITGLPDLFLPVGFNEKQHSSYMKLINPANSSTVRGESGDNIGRGGRSLIYFKDEAAHYDRPEKIEAALADNTRVQIDISSVNGLGNVFQRRRESGREWIPGKPLAKGQSNVFVMDWRDHPHKTQEWYDERRAKAESDGLVHVFAQEVDRDYSASVEGVIIPALWINAAVDAHKKLGISDSGLWLAGLDVADEGLDKNALVKRKGIVLKSTRVWGERDTGVTTRNALAECRDVGTINLQYDCIGIGAGVKAEANRLKDEGLIPSGVKFTPWSAAAGVLNPKQNIIEDDPDTPINSDFYENLKAQGWWELRRRFEKTYRYVVHGIKFPHDELISIDGNIDNLATLIKELSQATKTHSGRLKLMVNKTPEGTVSPNIADAVVMAYWPVPEKAAPVAMFGTYS